MTWLKWHTILNGHLVEFWAREGTQAAMHYEFIYGAPVGSAGSAPYIPIADSGVPSAGETPQ